MNRRLHMDGDTTGKAWLWDQAKLAVFLLTMAAAVIGEFWLALAGMLLLLLAYGLERPPTEAYDAWEVRREKTFYSGYLPQDHFETT